MSDYGMVTETGTVRFTRLLAAPVERIWDYLTQSELRRTWFAGGDMELRPGGALTLVFRNSELSHHGEEVPEKYLQYEGMESKGEIVEADPPSRLVFDWFEESGPPTRVAWELEPRGDQTLMTLTHSRLPNRAMTVDVSGGWHVHLDMLEALMAGRTPGPFWSANERYTKEYEERVPPEAG
jgi:uncharacterized protein YndB with AHSA1/START domain